MPKIPKKEKQEEDERKLMELLDDTYDEIGGTIDALEIEIETLSERRNELLGEILKRKNK